MFSKKQTIKYTEDYWQQIEIVRDLINNADAIVIGAGAGLSTAAGLTYHGKRFEDNFSDFIKKYKLRDMYSAGFYPYDTLEEYWAYWSRHIYLNRYNHKVGKPYLNLLNIVKEKDYFVLTTNVDHQFQLSGIEKKRLYYTQGDYGLFQCSKSCHQKTYDNEKVIKEMVIKQKNMKIPSELIPFCPICGAPMTTNLRIDDYFVEDEGWHNAKQNYINFLDKFNDKKVLFLELGVGNNTPIIIKYPFMKMTYQNSKANYVTINMEKIPIASEIKDRSISINSDLDKVLADLSV